MGRGHVRKRRCPGLARRPDRHRRQRGGARAAGASAGQRLPRRAGRHHRAGGGGNGAVDAGRGDAGAGLAREFAAWLPRHAAVADAGLGAAAVAAIDRVLGEESELRELWEKPTTPTTGAPPSPRCARRWSPGSPLRAETAAAAGRVATAGPRTPC
ncbi:DUF4259 domain-containing protein [Lysobacter enzymogenes]|nr:DUF4259 domain-containing protein [Lysobacter enzymogenes]